MWKVSAWGALRSNIVLQCPNKIMDYTMGFCHFYNNQIYKSMNINLVFFMTRYHGHTITTCLNDL